MQHSLHHLQEQQKAGIARGHTLSDIARLRFLIGVLMLVGSTIGVLGAAWDIQWHGLVGRDRTFTAPHDVILGAITIVGIAAIIEVLVETMWVNGNQDLRSNSTPFAGSFSGALGAYIAGFGTLSSAIAFPLDNYWHSLYGVDISLWAPFHIMLLTGGIISCLGMSYILVSAAHLAESQSLSRLALASTIGTIIALGILMQRLLTIIFPSVVGQGSLHLGGSTLQVYPFMISFFAVIACTIAVRAISWPGVATCVTFAYFVIYQITAWFVPPAMSYLLQIEHQILLPSAQVIGAKLIIAQLGQSPLIILMPLAIDIVVWVGRRQGWSDRAVTRGIVITAMLTMIIIAGGTLLALARQFSELSGGKASGGDDSASIVGLLISLLLALPGSWSGCLSGLVVGEQMQKIER